MDKPSYFIAFSFMADDDLDRLLLISYPKVNQERFEYDLNGDQRRNFLGGQGKIQIFIKKPWSTVKPLSEKLLP